MLQEYFAAQAAHRYCQAGFRVVYQDIIIGPVLDGVVSWLGNAYPVYLVVKCVLPGLRRRAYRIDAARHALTHLWRIMNIVCSIISLLRRERRQVDSDAMDGLPG